MDHVAKSQKIFSVGAGTGDPFNTTLEQIEDLIYINQLAQATELARLGNYSAAEEILQPLLETRPSHALLDLLARIKAQKGELESARLLWERALTIQPGCTECIAGLARVDAMQKSRSNPLGRLNLALKVVSFVAVLVMFGWLFIQIADLKNQKTPVAASNPQVMPAQFSEQQGELLSIVKSNQAAIQGLEGKLENLSGIPAPVPSPDPSDSFANQIKIEGEGLESTLSDGKLQVRFSNGLFQYNWSLAPGSRTLLKELSTQLEPWAGNIKIQVIGFADETEKKQSELTYMRAARVIETLTDSSSLPGKIFLIGPSETIPAPYPNNTLESRLKNRTVILIISAGDEE